MSVAMVVVKAHILQFQSDNLTVLIDSVPSSICERVSIECKHPLHGRLSALCDNQKRCQYAGWPGQHREAGECNEGTGSIRPCMTDHPPCRSKAGRFARAPVASMVVVASRIYITPPMRTHICRDCLSGRWFHASSPHRILPLRSCASTSRICSVRFASWSRPARFARRPPTTRTKRGDLGHTSTHATISVMAGTSTASRQCRQCNK